MIIRAPTEVIDNQNATYEGEVLKEDSNTREGRGILIRTDGTSYDGFFKDNKFYEKG